MQSLKEGNIRNNKFHVESTFKYLGNTKIGQCGCCSDAVSAHIVPLWKAFRELLPVLTNHAIQTKLRGNVCNICVRKVFLYGSVTLWLNSAISYYWHWGDQMNLWCVLERFHFNGESPFAPRSHLAIRFCSWTDEDSMDTCYVWIMMQEALWCDPCGYEVVKSK